MFNLKNVKKTVDINRNLLVCHKSDAQIVKIAEIGGKKRIVPVSGTYRDSAKIPVFRESENAYYTYAEFYRREYYMGIQPTENTSGICGISEDINRIGETWETYPTAVWDNPEDIMHELHTIKKLRVLFFLEVSTK
ncbi:MAG: hypothetical protein ACI4Q4_09830 [Oscillospiraceae bacterium]